MKKILLGFAAATFFARVFFIIALVYLHRTSFSFTQRSGIEVSTADTVLMAVKSSVRKVSNSRDHC